MLNPKQAAKYLNLSPRTLEAWRQQGKGPEYVYQMHGYRRVVRYSEEALKKFLTTDNSGAIITPLTDER